MSTSPSGQVTPTSDVTPPVTPVPAPGMSAGTKTALTFLAGLLGGAAIGAGALYIMRRNEEFGVGDPRLNPLMAGDYPYREARPYVRAAIEQGWTLEHGGKHFKLRSPTGQTVVMAGTPSDPNAYKAIQRDLRRAGVPV